MISYICLIFHTTVPNVWLIDDLVLSHLLWLVAKVAKSPWTSCHVIMMESASCMEKAHQVQVLYIHKEYIGADRSVAPTG